MIVNQSIHCPHCKRMIDMYVKCDKLQDIGVTTISKEDPTTWVPKYYRNLQQAAE